MSSKKWFVVPHYVGSVNVHWNGIVVVAKFHHVLHYFWDDVCPFLVVPETGYWIQVASVIVWFTLISSVHLKASGASPASTKGLITA